MMRCRIAVRIIVTMALQAIRIRRPHNIGAAALMIVMASRARWTLIQQRRCCTFSGTILS